MPVKKPAKKKAAKKKATPRMKTAICTINDSHEIFEGVVDCPYCDANVDLEEYDEPPTKGQCSSCGKHFKVKWEEQ